MQSLLSVLHNHSLPAYTPTNGIIPPYDWASIIPTPLPVGGEPYDILMLDASKVPVWVPATDISGSGLPSGGSAFDLLMLDDTGTAVWSSTTDIPGIGGGTAGVYTGVI
jgi:hypothetical protein